ncbi:MAG: class I SAM-dependent methyltransferase [Myxococcota bacterium]
MKEDPFSILADPRVEGVLRRLHDEADAQMPGLLWHYLPKLPKMLLGGRLDFSEADGFYADKFIALERHQAAFCYLAAISIKARTIVEFGSSLGVSTIWLAAAARAAGNGKVIGTELVPEKAERARAHIEEAGLSGFAEIRTGDARETLSDLNGEVDLFLNDGFPDLALEMLGLLTPRLRPGAVVITDNVGTFRGNYREYQAFLRESRNGFMTTTLPFKSGTEYSVRQQLA